MDERAVHGGAESNCLGRNGGLYIVGSRVSLDSVVISFQEGDSPEQIVQSFSTLKLSQVYGAIAYYLENERRSTSTSLKASKNSKGPFLR